MKGPGGVQLGEMGQSIVKAATDNTKQQATQWAKATASQVMGKPVGQTGQQRKAPDAAGDFGRVLEQNQSQQTPTANSSQQPPRVTHEAEFKQQNEKDQRTLANTRDAIQEEMDKIREAREQNWEEQNQEEKQEKKMEELKEEQQNQQPVRAGSPNPEGGKNKG